MLEKESGLQQTGSRLHGWQRPRAEDCDQALQSCGRLLLRCETLREDQKLVVNVHLFSDSTLIETSWRARLVRR